MASRKGKKSSAGGNDPARPIRIRRKRVIVSSLKKRKRPTIPAALVNITDQEEGIPREETEWQKVYLAAGLSPSAFESAKHDDGGAFKVCIGKTLPDQHQRLLPDPWSARMAQATATQTSTAEFGVLPDSLPELHHRGRPRHNASLFCSLHTTRYAHHLEPDVYLLRPLQDEHPREPLDEHSQAEDLYLGEVQYEMDEQDSRWLLALNNSLLLADWGGLEYLSEGLFESIMDSFERHFFHLVPTALTNLHHCSVACRRGQWLRGRREGLHPLLNKMIRHPTLQMPSIRQNAKSVGQARRPTAMPLSCVMGATLPCTRNVMGSRMFPKALGCVAGVCFCRNGLEVSLACYQGSSTNPSNRISPFLPSVPCVRGLVAP